MKAGELLEEDVSVFCQRFLFIKATKSFVEREQRGIWVKDNIGERRRWGRAFLQYSRKLDFCFVRHKQGRKGALEKK